MDEDTIDSQAVTNRNVSAGGDLPQEFLQQWKRLSMEDQQTFQNYLQHMSLVDNATVEVKTKDEGSLDLVWKRKGPFDHLSPETANTVRRVNKDKQNEQIEAVLQSIEFIQKNKLPRGLVLNQDKVQAPVTSYSPVQGCEKMAEILGKGNSAGEVTVFTDKKTGQDMALKTVMLSQFNANEMRLWVHMGDEGLAPELYHFELKDNKLVFTMEIMSGQDLQDIIDEKMRAIPDPGLIRDFSLCILHDLLEIWEKMRSQDYIHGDMHAGNVRLEHSMKVKIFDFGRARNLLTEETNRERLVKNDLVGIIRVFCALYSGFDFDNIFHAVKILKANNLKELDENMIFISEDHRKEMYQIMTMLFDSVRGDWNPKTYGNTTRVSSYIESVLSEDMDEIKRKVAVIIFPEHFQYKIEQPTTGFQAQGGVCDDVDSMLEYDSVWDDPDMDEYINNVTPSALKKLGLC